MKGGYSEKIFVVLTNNIKSISGQSLNKSFQWSFNVKVNTKTNWYTNNSTPFDLHGGKGPVAICAADVDGTDWPQSNHGDQLLF